MSARLLCATPLPPAVAARAAAEFGAITSQERQLGTDETIAMLQADAALRAVLISSQRFGLGDMLELDFHGKTLGIVGMGRIGQAVARRARGFGIKILYHNRRRLAPELEQGAEYFDDLRAMLPRCQILSLHTPAASWTA